MNSDFLRLNRKDFARGLALAVLVAFLGIIQQSLETSGFAFSTYDWGKIFEVVVIATTGYLTKNLISQNNKVLGSIG